jgi:hypothetical protein
MCGLTGDSAAFNHMFRLGSSLRGLLTYPHLNCDSSASIRFFSLGLVPWISFPNLLCWSPADVVTFTGTPLASWWAFNVILIFSSPVFNYSRVTRSIVSLCTVFMITCILDFNVVIHKPVSQKNSIPCIVASCCTRLTFINIK